MSEPELDLYSWYIQNVLEVIIEANTFIYQKLIEATLSTKGYSKWQPR